MQRAFRQVRSGSADHLAFSGPLKTRCKTVSKKIAVTSKPITDSAVAHVASGNDALENQEFADEPIQARQPERCEDRDAHQSAKHRRDFAQAAEVIQPAQPAAALFQKADEPEQNRRGQTVIEHLQQHAVERGGFFAVPRRRRRR